MFVLILMSFVLFTAVMFFVLSKVAASVTQQSHNPVSNVIYPVSHVNHESNYDFSDFTPYPSDETIYQITVIYQDASSVRFNYLIAPGMEDEYLQKKICRSILVRPNHMYTIDRQSGNALLVRAYQM